MSAETRREDMEEEASSATRFRGRRRRRLVLGQGHGGRRKGRGGCDREAGQGVRVPSPDPVEVVDRGPERNRRVPGRGGGRLASSPRQKSGNKNEKVEIETKNGNKSKVGIEKW